MPNEDRPTPDISSGVINDQLVLDLVQKYADIFTRRFPTVDMRVHFTDTGLPPTPLGIKRPQAPPSIAGAFIKVRNNYLIGIQRLLKPTEKLSTFFHEYGHALHRIMTNDDASDGPGLIESETTAMLSSLRLPDCEGLPEVAAVSVVAIRGAANISYEYQKAFEKVSRDPLWLKYGNDSSIAGG